MELTVDSARYAAVVRGVNVQKTRTVASIILDVDLCISQIDGIEWLAARRGELVARKVAAIAAQTRDGAIPPERSYAERLAVLRPRREEVDALAQAYLDAIAPGCADTVARLRRAGVRVVIVSRGLRHAMYRLAYRLMLDSNDVHAVDVRFDSLGAYRGFDHTSPLTSAAGKRAVVAELDLEGPVLVAGDAPIEHAFESFEQLASFVLP